MPGLTIGAQQLDPYDIPMALPGFIEHEAILRRRIAMQNRLMEHGLAAHGVKHSIERPFPPFSLLPLPHCL